ncbi:LysR family transcriptional regulator [Sphingobium sp. OAS761]|uniref:LysR family transcriptional regulator n=1 Tax=Sphingobium sp. OAS761 TaxID=2817901 RepID=UPI00209E69FF
MVRHSLLELDAVLAVSRHRSFRAAAVDLGMSTTALSNSIAKLERQLGVRLFNRTTRSVSLTDAGRRFVDHIGPALSDIHGAMDIARSQQATPSGVLRINAFATAAREVLAPLLLAFLRRYPQVSIDLVTEGRLVDVVADGFDFGIRSRDLVPTDMIAIPVGPPRRNAVVASPAYLEAHGVPRTPGDLDRHACIAIRLPNGAPYRWHFEKDGRPLPVDVAGPITLDEPSLTRITMLEGLAIGYMMEADVREDIAAGRLVHLLADWMPQLAPLCLYYAGRKNPSAAFRALVDLARERANAG